MQPRPVQRLAADAADEILDVLCDSFRDYPVMRFVLGDRGDDYDSDLRVLIRLFVMSRVMRSEPLLGVFDESGLVAAAIVSDPATVNGNSFVDLMRMPDGYASPELSISMDSLNVSPPAKACAAALFSE